ncbi:DUF485 domain-containing protein, partial [Staphylococcus aureus]
RSLVLPLSAFFFIWYFAYVLLGAYAHDFMATPVIGNINLGILLGLGQLLLDLLDALAELVVVGRLQVTQVQRLDDVPRGVADAYASRLGCIGGTVHAGRGVTTE